MKDSLSLLDLADRFATEDQAREWFEGLVWGVYLFRRKSD